MRTRRWLRRGLLGIGAVGVVTGVVLAANRGNCDPPPGLLTHPDLLGCEAARSGRTVRAVGVLAVGAIVAAIASQIGSGAPDEVELRRIAAFYNRASGGGVSVSGSF
jgi:hypothetical protein